MSVLTDIIHEREHWAQRQKAMVVYHHCFIIIAECTLVAEIVFFLMVYKELAFVFVRNLIEK